jgi:tripeptide aminopeptidase
MAATLNTRAFSQVSPREQVTRLAALPAVHEALAWLQRSEAELRRFQLDVARIPAPPFGERKRAEWLAQRWRELGLEEVEIDAAGNVTALRKGADPRARLLLLSAHIDTVFPAETPMQARAETGRLYGPGISDNAAGITALFAVASALKAGGIAPRAGILFVGNVGEEGEGDLRGMRYLYGESRYKDRIGPALILDGAGTDSIVTQGLGSRRFEVTVWGPGGHSWTDFGVPNPIVILSRAVSRFSDTAVPDEPRTSYNIGTITGGTSVNSIPESAAMRVDIRSSSRAEMDRVEKVLREAVAAAVREVQEPRARRPQVTFEIRQIGSRPVAELAPEARVYNIVRAVDAFLEIRSTIRRASTDANIPFSLGREAVSLGAGGNGGGAHTLGEWFDPAGRDVGLKRILLAVLALAGAE